ncbi:MAG: class I SAM-dependent methyltransferase [Asticcacaulis sp.]
MLQAFLKPMMKSGRLTVQVPGSSPLVFGQDDPQPSQDIEITIKTQAILLWIGLNPELHFGEAYMNGDLTVTRGDLWSLMELIGQNLANRPPMPPLNAWLKRRREMLTTRNNVKASRNNVAHHYDLSEALYRTFLDADMQYSCAYFSDPGMTLEEAQLAKKLHLIAKLNLRPGLKVLDIGCGWGGMALEIARRADVEVLGITLSQEQLAVARRRAQEEGLEDRVRFELCDYRELQGEFDRIISVGMFEHVGPSQFQVYFDQVKRLLKEDGVAVVHTIGHEGNGGGTNIWLDKYIFPGGYIPALSQITGAVEGANLWATDIEILRKHYAETLRHWRLRFMAARDKMAELYDERFCRMWEFYLALCEMGFRYSRLMVVQVQLTRKIDVLPITRDYMREEEAMLAQ